MITKTHEEYSLGLTLIELLVVISVISLIASIALATLNSSRDKAIKANIQANLETVRSQAEIFYSENGRYGPTFSAVPRTPIQICAAQPQSMFCDPTIMQAITVADQFITDADPSYAIGPDGQSYAVSVPLLKGGASWCVTSTGGANGIAHGNSTTVTYCGY